MSKERVALNERLNNGAAKSITFVENSINFDALI
jgi:hypothetical protein